MFLPVYARMYVYVGQLWQHICQILLFFCDDDDDIYYYYKLINVTFSTIRPCTLTVFVATMVTFSMVA